MIENLVGFAAAPALILAVVAHISGAISRALGDATASAKPLLADIIGIAWAFALFDAGMLPGVENVPVVVLAGVALGVATGLARDQLTGRGLRLRRTDDEDTVPSTDSA